MRTTLDLDEDVLLAVKERARLQGRGAGGVLSELARQALAGRYVGVFDAGKAADLFGFAPFPAQGAPVSNPVVERLREVEGI